MKPQPSTSAHFGALAVTTLLTFLTAIPSYAVERNLTIQAEAVSDRIIVKYKDNGSTSNTTTMSQKIVDELSLQAGVSMQSMRRLTSGAQLMKMDKFHRGVELDAVIARLQQNPNIEYAEPDLLLQPMAIPNDPNYNQQWHYFESAAGIALPAAWDTTQGAGVVVGVIDTGYRPHVDLVDNLLPGYDMIADTNVAQDGNGRDSDATDPGDWSPAGACGPGRPPSSSSWHGTHVAGTVAAASNNNIGVAGVAYAAKVVPIRALGRCGGYTSDIADAIIWGAGAGQTGLN